MKFKITTENYEAFKKYISDPEKVMQLRESLNETFCGKWNNEIPRKIEDLFKALFNLAFIRYEEKYTVHKASLQDMDVLVPFAETRDRNWEAFGKDNFYYVTFSGHNFFYLKEFAEVVEEPDYESMTIEEMKRALLKGNSEPVSFMPAEMNQLSISEIKEDLSELDKKKREIDKLKDDLSWNREKSLAKIEEQIQKLKNQLSDRKKVLQEELNAQMEKLNEKANQLKKEIIVLESEIYSIKSYTGETLELTKVRSGRTCKQETPLVVNQKIAYLDEDLARIVSIYQEEISTKYSDFEDAVKNCDDVFEKFCPQERSITFFKLSKNGTYSVYDHERKMYERETLIHGSKMGCILRDGDNAFVGWLDETWGYENDGKERKVSFTDNLMYKPDESVSNIEDENRLKSDNPFSMVSRIFAMSVLQGMIDNKKLVTFPEKINVMQPSQYVVYNYADAWIADERFGSFDLLTENLRTYTREKDIILVIFNINGYGERSVGDADRTSDCYIKEGVYELNLIKNDNYYVKAERKYHKTNSNFNIKKEEYINISYMNSIWLKYYVQTKKLGSYCHDYAKVIKHFKRAIEVIIERETEEIEEIKKYYPKADQIEEWQIKLSHWKIKNGIRKITEFQAKRVAKYFETGVFYEMANLFSKEKINSFSINKIYSKTCLRINEYTVSVAYSTSDEEFGTNSNSNKNSYAYETFYCDDRIKSYETKLEKEKKQKTINEKMKEIYSRVPARVIQDEKKLERIRVTVSNYLKEMDISAQEIRKNDAYGIFKNPFISCDSTLNFVKSNALIETEVKKIQNGTDINIFYANETTTKSPLWVLYYHNYLQECYDNIMKVAGVVLHKRWISEIKYCNVQGDKS